MELKLYLLLLCIHAWLRARAYHGEKAEVRRQPWGVGSPSTFAWVHLHSAHCSSGKAESTPASQWGTFQDSNSRLHGPFKLWLQIRNSVIPWSVFCWAGRMIFLFQWKESTLRKTFIPTQGKTCPITDAGKFTAIASFLFEDMVPL